MSTLIIQLPAHQRLSSDPALADSAAGTASSSIPKDYAYVLTVNGETALRQGVSPAAHLPKADIVVAVTAPTDLSWHRIVLTKAPSARLRQARQPIPAMQENAHSPLRLKKHETANARE